jgi:hypothetical protein
MLTGIIGLLGTLAALTFWWVKRRAAAADDPVTQDAQGDATADAAIAHDQKRTGPAYETSADLQKILDDLERRLP